MTLLEMIIKDTLDKQILFSNDGKLKLHSKLGELVFPIIKYTII